MELSHQYTHNPNSAYQRSSQPLPQLCGFQDHYSAELHHCPQAKTHVANRSGEFPDYKRNVRRVTVTLSITGTRLTLFSPKTNLWVCCILKSRHCLFHPDIFHCPLCSNTAFVWLGPPSRIAPVAFSQQLALRFVPNHGYYDASVTKVSPVISKLAQ